MIFGIGRDAHEMAHSTQEPLSYDKYQNKLRLEAHIKRLRKAEFKARTISPKMVEFIGKRLTDKEIDRSFETMWANL